jgi:hypothetical protein
MEQAVLVLVDVRRCADAADFRFGSFASILAFRRHVRLEYNLGICGLSGSTDLLSVAGKLGLTPMVR